MAFLLSRFVRAPIGEVFAFFDDPAHTTEFNEHAERLEVVDVQPDGRRTFDIVMRSSSREWMLTVEQVLREPPRRLVTLGGSWTTSRQERVLTVITDRRFSVEGAGTRVDVNIETQLDDPLRRPLQAIRNWLQRGATRTEFERQLSLIAEHIEAQPRV